MHRVYVQVTRDGRRVEISIYDIVVGDVIPLNIGDQASCMILSMQYFLALFRISV